MNIIPIKTYEETFKVTVCQCYHCGEKFGSPNGICANFCKFCKTADQRKAVDMENEEIWAKEGKEFKCRFCEAMKIYNANR